MRSFKESFETDGVDTRYTVENPSDDGSNDFFARRLEGSAGTRPRGGALDGDWFWGARDLDGDGVEVNDLEDHEARITWSDAIDISGLGNITIKVAVAQGDDGQEFDNPIAFQYMLDDGDWLTAGGFRGLHSNSPSYYFEGGNFDVSAGLVPLATDPRLTRKFREWEFRIFGTGNQLRIRVFVNANGSSEEYAFDNIRVCAEDSLSIFDLSINNDSFIESAVEGELTIALDAPAPTGGVVFTIEDSDINDTDADLPS